MPKEICQYKILLVSIIIISSVIDFSIERLTKKLKSVDFSAQKLNTRRRRGEILLDCIIVGSRYWSKFKVNCLITTERASAFWRPATAPKPTPILTVVLNRSCATCCEFSDWRINLLFSFCTRASDKQCAI